MSRSDSSCEVASVMSCWVASRSIGLWLMALAMASPRPMRAQGTVSGRVTLAEPASSARRDVANAVVYLEPVNRPARYAGTIGTPSAMSIVMRDREFIPRVQIVRAGQSVDFPNQDPFSHNVFSNTSLGGFDLGLYRRGATRAWTFSRVGVYAIYCNIHASMVSFVIAVPGNAYARVGADGRFSMADVPAGSYKLHVWHERTPEIVEQLEVPPAGVRDLSVALDTRGFPATAHLNKFGQPYPASRADRY
jgi:plastocyanin